MRIGSRVRAVREVRRLSVEQLAKLANLRVQFMKEIESGAAPSVHTRTIQKLADHLDVPLNFLLTGDREGLEIGDPAGRHYLITLGIKTAVYGMSMVILCGIMALIGFAVLNLARSPVSVGLSTRESR